MHAKLLCENSGSGVIRKHSRILTDGLHLSRVNMQMSFSFSQIFIFYSCYSVELQSCISNPQLYIQVRGHSHLFEIEYVMCTSSVLTTWDLVQPAVRDTEFSPWILFVLLLFSHVIYCIKMNHCQEIDSTIKSFVILSAF